MCLHIPVVLAIADQLKEHVSIPEWKQEILICACKLHKFHKGAMLPKRNP